MANFLYESAYYGVCNFGNSLNHSGTKGMKWGRRLYQNSDGSLTPLGRIHYGVGDARKKAGEATAKQTKKAQKISENASRGFGEASKIPRTFEKYSKRNNPDLSSLSDEELSNYIRRKNLERQYVMLSSSEKTSGYQIASDVLSTVGSVTAVVAAGIGIAVGIKELKGK